MALLDVLIEDPQRRAAALDSCTGPQFGLQVVESYVELVSNIIKHIEPGNFLLPSSISAATLDHKSDTDTDMESERGSNLDFQATSQDLHSDEVLDDVIELGSDSTYRNEGDSSESESDTDEFSADEMQDEDIDEAVGEGDIVVAGNVMRVHDYLGSEYSNRIRDLYAVAPMLPTALPELSTEPRSWQLDLATKINHCCQGPNRGCIVADEMGLGKTLGTLLALQLSRKAVPGIFDLVVTTKSCVPQCLFQDLQPRVFVLEDPKMTATKLLDADYDIVICSYGFLRSQYRLLQNFKRDMQMIDKAGSKPGAKIPRRPTLSLFSELYRDLDMPIRHIVLDEVQYAKKEHGVAHKAVKSLYYSRNIMLSGTFLSNKWHDVFGVLDFLPGHPFQTRRGFMHTFGTRFDRTWLDPAPTKRARLVKFLMAITIARPSKLLKLPGKNVVAKEFKLGEEQANIVFHYVSKFFECLRFEGITAGRNMIQNDKAMKAMSFAVRAQQHAAHPALIKQKRQSQPYDTFATEVVATSLRGKLIDGGTLGTAERLEVKRLVDAMIFGKSKDRATTDRGNNTRKEKSSNQGEGNNLQEGDKLQEGGGSQGEGSDFQEEESELEEEESDTDEELLEKITKTNSRLAWLTTVRGMPDKVLLSPRVTAIIDIYQHILKGTPSAKIVIFSKFLRFLDILEQALQRKSKPNQAILRFDGTLDNEERTAVKSRFNNIKSSVILLISSGAGGAGLNLASGEHIVRCEPWWNANDERQADCRLYRQGQEKTVFVWAVTASNSSIDILIETIRDAKIKTIEEIMKPLRHFPGDPISIPEIAKHY
ncbi:hypothetical protein FGG08_001458 [Glutinoglossum americanum]|uniref:Uncharacterized protein n=1 Tax=Glutinoglossum americanum TaxID=1670608 RepID=A0A9P8IDJ5_9PEZI|nr:hypothetical protein FGG08_001458 [Glutinoglossum americanum]